MYKSFQEDLEEIENPEQKLQIKTRQDKWISKALNVVNGVVEIQPYKFKSETCIKMNDIEAAVLELDKIESQIDSEHQAAVLNRVVRQEARPKSYFFTIKIREAKGLPACDMNGLSDPYVTLVMDKKQIAKTRTIYEDLNPVWNETFELTITRQTDLILTVWDENSVMNHNLCGRTLINIAPNGFRDFEPQEYWLDLKPEGQLLIDITMESERDDIRFYFGKSYRKLMRTESDMVREIVGKFQAFIKYTISLNKLRSLTSTKFNMNSVTNLFKAKQKPRVFDPEEANDVLNPLYDFLNENFRTLAIKLSPTLKIKVMTQTWEVVLETLELLLIPPLSDKRTVQTPLSVIEKDILIEWSNSLLQFFYQDGHGIAMEILKTRKYQEFVAAMTDFYDRSTDELKRMCNRSATESFQMLKTRNMVSDMMRRTNTVMAHQNRRVLRKAQEQLMAEEQKASGAEVIILRILRLRGEYEFVGKRLQQLNQMSRSLATESYMQMNSWRQ